MGWLADETGLDKCTANYTPLTPLSYLSRAADVFGHRTALVWKSTRLSYVEYGAEVSRLASGLGRHGIGPGDVVATLLPNIPAQAIAHFAVPAAGAVLNTINIRLDPDTVAYIFGHAEAKIVLVDAAFVGLAEAAIQRMQGRPPQIIEVVDHGFTASGRYLTFDQLQAQGDPQAAWIMPQDEWESIAINYTSGTTGHPKGVVVHHRGAYLSGPANAIGWRMSLFPVYLTIVPLFHCNGWGHTWMMPMLGGQLTMCRDVSAKAIYDAIAEEGVTHFGAAPIVLNALINAKSEERQDFSHVVEVFTAGSPPPAATLAAVEPLGFNITQVYGMTETYGPSVETLYQAEWEGVPIDDRAGFKARTGVANAMLEELNVLSPSGTPIARDGKALGEVTFRGNLVMKGYYKNPEATAEAFRGGQLWSGDIAFRHPDGYVKLTDRAKDIIISGGENISSVEVESTLMHHPAVSLCAVVAKPDAKWGEVPCAFVELKPGMQVSEAELIAHCRARLAGFATPKMVVFAELPKTSTGKIQKFELRAAAKLLS
jgi:fatty-acyl-CoA synthase